MNFADFVVGLLVALALFLGGFAVWDVSKKATFDDLREQCERQGSIRLGKEAFFYCAREPQK